ncbi:hypothetical protein J1605_010570 [Eschrichtius robustus]|uniref:TSC22 domain family protein 3 n=1 Tax=Eschrichtius robustus TaxID=9764 RepID=A0AB34GNC9_ESCRO|nr:hypothetical protein J1605_010570 [Eschrichtius robustus]
MGWRPGTPWAARPHCLHVAEQASLARAPPDPRAAPRGALGGGGAEPVWVGRCSFLQGPETDLGTKCPELRASEAIEEELGQMEGSVATAASASGASVVAIDNKIEQAMDLVKNHLMYAVREEVEILKEQIRELVEKNSQLERENTLLKTLASPEQLEKFQSRLSPEEPAPETPEAPEAPGGSAV